MQEAAWLTFGIQSDNDQLEVLSQRYDAAQEHLQALEARLDVIERQRQASELALERAQARLHDTALAAYENGSNATQGVPSILANGTSRTLALREYLSVGTDDLIRSENGLRIARATLDVEQREQAEVIAQAKATLAQIKAAQTQTQQISQLLKLALNAVNGQIGQMVQLQELAELSSQQAAFKALVAQDVAAGPSANPAPLPSDPRAAAALKAAQSQLGVPYVWGAEQPGQAFDCSGLTQWAWGQAGVGLPRTAQEQYDAIAHVALYDLEPGDLVFWDDGTPSVQHVAMYVGAGLVIQAPYTGSSVGYSGIWADGLVGAGRP